MAALRASTPPEDDVRAVIGHRLREAAVLDARGEPAAARTATRRAVAAAEGDQLRWPFVEVTAAEPVVRQYLRGGVGFSEDLRQVLARDSSASSSRARRTAPGMVEALTERELVVLAYLPRRIKQRDIAAELYITMNTLKTHLASIYRKLGVTDRDEAAARAAELGLL